MVGTSQLRLTRFVQPGGLGIQKRYCLLEGEKRQLTDVKQHGLHGTMRHYLQY